MISSVALAHYGVSRANDWVSVDCGAVLYSCAAHMENRLDSASADCALELSLFHRAENED